MTANQQQTNDAGVGVQNAGQVAQELLDILVCPQTRASVVLHDGWLYSTDPKTRRKYPIRDGIPIMLIDDSEEATEDEFARIVVAK